MLLKRIAPALPAKLAEHIPTLEYYNVRTTENLVYTPRPHLANLPLPPHELDQIIAHCLQLTGPGTSKGSEEYSNSKGKTDDPAWLGWGVRGLDELLDWDGVGVMEIAGSKRVGKSLLALYAALRVLSEDPEAVCRWIDTEGAFSPTRARDVLEIMGHDAIEDVLDRLIVTPCFQVEPELFEILDSLSQELSDTTLTRKTRILVIDPIVSLFKDTLTSTTAQGHAAMVTVMGDINALTYTHDLLTIITNTTASSLPNNPLSAFSATTTKPSLGTAFGYLTDISLLVQETGKVFGMVDENERERTRQAPGLRAVVEVVKSRVSPAGRWAVFETDGIRLFDVVPPPQEDERTMMMSEGLQVGEARPIHGPLSETIAP